MIIAFSGLIKSGKDTASDFLVNEFGYKKIAFADNLKKLCMGVFGLTKYQVHTQSGKVRNFKIPITATMNDVWGICYWLTLKNDFKFTVIELIKIKKKLVGVKFYNPRQILQHIGCEVLRGCIRDDFHLNVFKNNIDNKDNIVVPDVRYKNEADLIKSIGGRVIRINRTTETKNSHESENGLNGYEFDAVIDNDGSLNDFKKEVLKKSFMCT